MTLERNLGFDLQRATEAAALRAARWMGRGDKNEADQAAVDAMRFALNAMEMDGIVVIGEGEKDEAPMLYIGEELGQGNDPKVDIAVDPVEGTTLLAQGMPGAIAVVAAADRGSMFNPPGIVYMDKIAVGETAKGSIDINASPADNIAAVAKALRKNIEDVTVVVLDRPRHADLIAQIRETGARIKLILHGDVAGSMMPSMVDSPADILMGIGGAPESVISACIMKCTGGEIQCKLWPRNEAERRAAAENGLDINKVYMTNDLVRSDNVFVAATGITTGEMLRGVQYFGWGSTTHSLVMRSASGTVRYIESRHRWDKLMRISDLPFDAR